MKMSHKVRVGAALGVLLGGAYLFGSTGVINDMRIEEGRKYVNGELVLPVDLEEMEFAIGEVSDYCEKVYAGIDTSEGAVVGEVEATEAARCIFFISEVAELVDEINARGVAQ